MTGNLSRGAATVAILDIESVRAAQRQAGLNIVIGGFVYAFEWWEWSWRPGKWRITGSSQKKMGLG